MNFRSNRSEGAMGAASGTGSGLLGSFIVFIMVCAVLAGLAIVVAVNSFVTHRTLQALHVEQQSATGGGR